MKKNLNMYQIPNEGVARTTKQLKTVIFKVTLYA